jgi:hypothetical protein
MGRELQESDALRTNNTWRGLIFVLRKIGRIMDEGKPEEPRTC